MWKASPKYSNKKLLAGWLLSCSNLEFTNDIIINATFDTTKFRMKCRPYVTQLLNEIATKIQSLSRMHLAKKKVQKKRIQQKKKLKKLKNKRLKEKLSSSGLKLSSGLMRDDHSMTSIGTEYSSSLSPSPRNEVNIGSALEGGSISSISTDLGPFQSSLHSISTTYTPMKNGKKQKPLSQPMIRRMKETITAYSSTNPSPAGAGAGAGGHVKKKRTSTNSLSQGSLTQPPSSSSPSLLMEQVKYLKNDLTSSLHHRQNSSSFSSSSDSEMKEMMKNVLSEIKALRSDQGNNNNHNNNTTILTPQQMMSMPSSSSYSSSSENQTEIKQNLDTMLSQILHIQQDLTEQKELSTNISLQIQEQHQAMILMKKTTSSSEVEVDVGSGTTHQDNGGAGRHVKEVDEYELKIKKYEGEVEKLQQLLMKKDKELQLESQQYQNIRHSLQKEITEMTFHLDSEREKVRELEQKHARKCDENTVLKENIYQLEQNHSHKQQELMLQIQQTVRELSVTKEEIENYEKNILELNSNYSNSLLQNTILKSEIEKYKIENEMKQKQINENVKNEKKKSIQQLDESQKKINECEQLILLLNEEKRQLLDEIAQQKILISNTTTTQATHATQLQRQQENEKKLQNDYENLLKETNHLRELIVEKDAYTQSLQSKFSELEIKSQQETEKSVQDTISLQSLLATHEEDMKVNHYLRSRLKEAEERVYLLEQHQLEVENLKYQTMKPPPYEMTSSLKPTTTSTSTLSNLKATSASFVDKIIFDQQTIQVCVVTWRLSPLSSPLTLTHLSPSVRQENKLNFVKQDLQHWIFLEI
jgi:hypothetical protein